MRIPPHWARGSYSGTDRSGQDHTVTAYGWSLTSLTEAKAGAVSRAKRAFERLASGATRDSYEYLDHPLREEIVDSLNHAGDEVAVITRNRYGALVLNSASVCFVDIDCPRAHPAGLLEGILLLFSGERRRARARAVREETLRGVRDWAERNRRRSLRVYRTCAGLRLLFTDRLYEPTSVETADLFTELKCDPLYQKLTQKQESFRARLTPKPWRCGCPPPPKRYPWISPEAESANRDWQGRYDKKSHGYVTCELLETLGHAARNEHIAAIVEMHDHHACGAPGAELA